jgi:hypothetical protein
MEIHIAEEERMYDGSQLSSHFALKAFKVRGDAMVAFKGPMDVREDTMADLEDLLEKKAIRSASMLHFILEFFGRSLESTVLLQRLLSRLAADILRQETGADVKVEGDDLYVEDRKLSVSIAAPSPVSTLIHFGLNIRTEDVPVKAVSLTDLGMDSDRMASLLSDAFARELASVRWAVSKVKAVP